MELTLEIPDLATILQQVITSGAPLTRDVQDHHGRWHQLRIRPHITLDQIDGAVLVALDVDSLKRSEEHARENEERLRITQDQAPIGISESDRNGRILRVNDSFCRLLGYTREELLTKRLEDIIHAEDLIAVHSAVQRVWNNAATSYRLEKRYLHRDGHLIWVEVTGFVIRGERGEQRKVVLAQDISERRRVEAALRESESRFRTLVDSTPVLIWVSGPAGCVFVNEAFRVFAGAPEETLLNDGWLGHLHADDRVEFEAAYERTLARNDHFQHIARFLRGDGQYRWMLAAAAPRAKGAMGVVGSLYDITALKEAEEALRRADHSKDEFLALLAHELRAPLASLHNVVELLRTSSVDGTTAEWGREVIARQVVNLTRMVDDLLDVSRIAHGKIVLRLEPVDLGAMLRRTAVFVEPSLDARQQTLTIDLPEQPVRLNADAVRLEQVFGNLLRNAGKFTPEGGHLALTLSIRATDRAGPGGMIAQVRVRDSGLRDSARDARSRSSIRSSVSIPHRDAGSVGWASA